MFMTGSAIRPPKEVRNMCEKSSLSPDAMKCFKVTTYQETSKILDAATEKTLAQVEKWEAEETAHRKAGGQ